MPEVTVGRLLRILNTSGLHADRGSCAKGALPPIMIRTRFASLLACLLLTWGAFAPVPTWAETVASGNDKTTNQLVSMLHQLNLVPNSRLSATVRDLRFVAKKYDIDPFLLAAICERETQWPYAAKGHEFAYNLKNNMQNFTGSATLPAPFFDLDTCAYGLRLQKDRFGSDHNAVIAAYFVGPTQVDEWKGNYPVEVKELLSNVWAMVATYQGPIKEEAKGSAGKGPAADTPRGALPHRGGVSRPALQANSYTDAVSQSYRTGNATEAEAEQAYIAVMRYFNKRISEQTARDIYISVAQYAREYEGIVDARLVMALVAAESSFNPSAVSRAGAQGLGQLMPYTAEGLNVADPFDINQNIRGTYAYLKREFERWAGYPDVLDRVLASYNAGPGAVKKHNGIPPYAETQAYVPKVLGFYCAILQPHERAAHLKGHTIYADVILTKYQ
ncbi:MAG: Membrane-bound lytic murein transglycosylase F [bacterium]|nr:Membrane-bound lytic murein transglycosylase F [bacterium]